MVDLSSLTVEDFRAHVGTAFRVRAELPEPIDLELVEARESAWERPPVGAARRPFALLFLGPPSDRYFMQATIPLSHPAMGDLDMFLVPVGATPQRRMQYEAIFS